MRPIKAVQDMADEISVHPADHPVVNVDDLEKVVVVGVSRATRAMENLAHPPILTALRPRHGLVLDNHQLTWPDIQKDRFRRWVA